MQFVGIKIADSAARAKLEGALQLALSDAALPKSWLNRTRRIAGSQKTFTPMLGTALLAKATDDSVNALALKTGNSHNSYSARGLATKVLVPFCVEHGINLRTTGAEPLNNQPFFRYESVDRHMKVQSQSDLEYLVECLEAADFLRGERALEALAAFLRVRLEDPASETVLAAVDSTPDLAGVRAHAIEFTTIETEGGKRGQAAVAGLLDLVFDEVRTSRINDPSRRFSGDILVGPTERPILSVEVRQKPVTATEVEQFVARLEREGIRKAMVAMLSPAQRSLSSDLESQAWSRHRVHLELLTGVGQCVDLALLWTALPLDEAVRHLIVRVHYRLQEIECQAMSLELWLAPFT